MLPLLAMGTRSGVDVVVEEHSGASGIEDNSRVGSRTIAAVSMPGSVLPIHSYKREQQRLFSVPHADCLLLEV
ncbi:unnamed protein product [Heligmosomoides polygyrus]|uniref:Uncharacterized protein n=1 Tax=Heligmosomoides polygyrus TaxID=6339 RepID=A0A3P7TL89_HELPZ|nr:unnamed protein product [Heligmosomoides polygyrus]